LALFVGRPRQLGAGVIIGVIITLLVARPHNKWFRLLSRASIANDDRFMNTAKQALQQQSEIKRTNQTRIWRARLSDDVAACLSTDTRKAKIAAGWEASLGFLANIGKLALGHTSLVRLLVLI
jgi:hypothetical protein